ncbi:MAG: sterol desaturase family protein [Acetobacteraceae bacterium]|nr:sterol desaturase family protein [Acetobacteraceae bacterium]
MVWELMVSILWAFGETIIKLLPWMVASALVFSALTVRFACNPGTAWWRSRDLVTDLTYWLVVPVFTRFLRIGLLVLGAALLFGISGEKEIIDFFENGHGPLARLPFWAQTAVYLLASDFMLYWIHRLFHGGPFWKYHAVHHSSEEVDWISAARFHPVNLSLGPVLVDVVLLLGGIPPAVLGILVPFNVLMSAFVHANLNWSLGPLRYVIASPLFHRWHHTAADKGGSRNFAGTFPVLDLMFGTFYMPEHALPGEYGVGDASFPRSFGGQLLYPFRR